jgi:hypothetical protein
VHLTVFTLQRSLELYQRRFGMARAGHAVDADGQRAVVVPRLAIGAGPQFIPFSQGVTRMGAGEQ